MTSLFAPLTLPNGVILENRVAKAAMEENLAEPGQRPGSQLFTLYRRWADGGAGLLISGNVMVSASAMTGPGGVVLDRYADLEPFRQWAKAGLAGGGEFWMQINHPGRQVYAAMGERAMSPSDSQVDVGSYSHLFAKAKEMTVREISQIIDAFTITAQRAEKAGFTGVQVHAAHGYLISQFLSPLVNKRKDQYGGGIEGRARLLVEICTALRRVLKPSTSLSVKLNSADFQKGGFSLADAKAVVQMLNPIGVDLLELSGGSYESPAMQGDAKSVDPMSADDIPQAANDLATDGPKPVSSSLAREAYFVDFARDVSAVAEMPIMVTGGIVRKSVAEKALEPSADGLKVDMLGIARALAFEPDLPNIWKNEKTPDIHIPSVTWSNRVLAALAAMALAKAQLHRLADGKASRSVTSPLFALLWDRWRMKRLTKRYVRWRLEGQQEAA